MIDLDLILQLSFLLKVARTKQFFEPNVTVETGCLAKAGSSNSVILLTIRCYMNWGKE